MRTDVKAFYESIDHHLMLDKPALYIKDRFTPNLLWQSMQHCVEQHLDKAFIGRIEKSFDFLGYRFSRAGLQLVAKTVANAVEEMQTTSIWPRGAGRGLSKEWRLIKRCFYICT